jgi:DNA polymerase
MLAVADLSQIEPRVLAWMSGYDALLDVFRAGGDPYAAFGSQMFGIPGMTKDSHPVERQSAKSALLGAGYGLGWASFAAQLLVGFLGAPPLRYTKADAKVLGVTQRDVERFMSWEDNIEKMGRIPHTCTESELLIHCLAAKAIIDKYRGTATPVVDFWNMNSNLIQSSLFEGEEYEFKCIKYRKEEIVLPSGMSLKYPDLRKEYDQESGKWQWTYGKDRTKLYAGKLTNNIIQGCARVVMTDGMLRIAKRHFVAGTVHDEAIAVVPEATAQAEYEWMLEQMVMEPKYMPGIPLAADGGFHKRYGLAKN